MERKTGGQNGVRILAGIAAFYGILYLLLIAYQYMSDTIFRDKVFASDSARIRWLAVILVTLGSAALLGFRRRLGWLLFIPVLVLVFSQQLIDG